MPTYEYRCTKCGHHFELFHSISDDSLKRCPRCRSKAVRVPAGGAGLLFKGSGFYITDHRSKSYREKAKKEKADSSEGGTPSKSSDGKSSGGASGKPSGGGSGPSSGGASGSSGA